MEQPRRVHITGGPGSGKTTAARRIAARLDLTAYHLDEIALDLEAALPLGGALAELAAKAPGLAEGPAWVSEGAYMGWAAPFFDSAELVVWLDTAAPVALYRILSRHVKAELRGDNRFPGWRRLYSFWRWSARYYLDRNPHRLNAYGVPHTRRFAQEWLAAYSGRLTVCRNKADFEALMNELFG